jgi:hypothetical protein
VPAGIAGKAIDKPLAAYGLIAQLATVIAHVIRVLDAKYIVVLHDVRAIFGIGAEEGMSEVFAVRLRVTFAVLALNLVDCAHGEHRRHLLKIDAYRVRHAGMSIQAILLESLAVLLLGAGLIENAELLLAEIGTEKAVGTALEIPRECAVRAGLAPIEVERALTACGEEAFVQKFALVDPQAVDAVAVLRRVGAVHAILFIVTAEGEVAVFIRE